MFEMKISWTSRALASYFKVSDYLMSAWTIKEVKNFENDVEKLLCLIKKNPKMAKVSKNKKNIRKRVISKHNSVLYRLKPRKEEIEILLFWDNRMNPKKRRI